ncbi:MAG TPA: GNAT family N-acetyltransferase [Chloroflexota bacterium]|nr:GNAT family N-acetyltransferase [Chloroflexota bacterium]
MRRTIAIRPALPTDYDFLRLVLVEAAFWRQDGPRPPVDEALARPGLARYLDGWGRPGDSGVVAEADATPVGAAWYRLFDSAEPGYGFVAPEIPELTVAVLREWRGRGAGTALLQALIERCRIEGRPALSLSVEWGNPARRLYERLGFLRCGEAGGSWTMRLDLATPPATRRGGSARGGRGGAR